MLWQGQRESDNVIDQRAVGGKTLGGGALVVGAIIYYLMGGNPLTYILQNAGSVQQSAPAVSQPVDDQRKSFASVVLADTEDVWSGVFQEAGRVYRKPKLVLFRGRVESACGTAETAAGPFYCPSDQRVYLDLSFLDELSHGLGAQGEFAAAYVIAHEVGHHVQNLLGIESASRERQRAMDRRERNQASVQIELQADCFAGVWAKQTERTKKVIEDGDIDQAMRAASAVGDDRLQKRAQGVVVPDSFTHGSSAQRVAAFRAGYEGGELTSCQ